MPTVLNNLQMISQWTVRRNVNVVLFRITMKWSRNNLLATDLLAQMADPNPWSLHPWEFTFMSSFITVRDSLSMACQCDLHNWILTSVLWICLFIHSINCNNSESSWNLNFTLGMLVFIVSMYNHSSTRFPYHSVNCHCGIYSTSLGTDSQCAWSFPGLGGVNMQMFSLLATSSRIKIIYGHLDDCSLLSFLPE